jgi:glycosyltransferase involved in cell wall biosynthesis
MPRKKTAIVYDWIDKWGGVERVLLELHSLLPEAEFYTSAVDYHTAEWARVLSPKTTFLQNIPAPIRAHRKFLVPFYPAAFESLDLREYDLVISVTSSFSKSVITRPDTFHLCYLLTPTRFLWSHEGVYLKGATKTLGRKLVSHMREWDLVAAQRPDAYMSISNAVQARAKQYYHVPSTVIYPPFNTGYWEGMMKKMKCPETLRLHAPFYLSVGRLESYKMSQMVVEAAKSMLNTHFVFAGTGSLLSKLKKTATPNCIFLEFVSDEELSYLYTNAEGLIFPQEEDFGYVALEAQYHGCPVIAFNKGGACETVTEGETGTFFAEQTAKALVLQLERYSKISYNLKRSTTDSRESLKKRFGLERFRTSFFYQLENR